MTKQLNYKIDSCDTDSSYNYDVEEDNISREMARYRFDIQKKFLAQGRGKQVVNTEPHKK